MREYERLDRNETFDGVALLDVIEHFDKIGRRNCLKGINRILRNDGILLISTTNSLSRPFYWLWTIYRGLFLEGDFRNLEAIWYCGRDHKSILNPFSLKKVLSMCGFDVVKTRLDTYDNLPHWVEVIDKKILRKVGGG